MVPIDLFSEGMPKKLKTFAGRQHPLSYTGIKRRLDASSVNQTRVRRD